jgi:hypothetical protein
MMIGWAGRGSRCGASGPPPPSSCALRAKQKKIERYSFLEEDFFSLESLELEDSLELLVSLEDESLDDEEESFELSLELEPESLLESFDGESLESRESLELSGFLLSPAADLPA